MSDDVPTDRKVTPSDDRKSGVLPTKTVRVVCAIGFLIVVIGNAMALRGGQPNRFSPGDYVRSFGLIVLLCGALQYLFATFFRRAIGHVVALSISADRQSHVTLEQNYRQRIAICYVGMVLSCLYVIYLTGTTVVQAVSYFGRYSFFWILHFLLSAIFPIAFALVFWVLVWVLKRMRAMENELHPFGDRVPEAAPGRDAPGQDADESR